jgi:putative membrane protein
MFALLLSLGASAQQPIVPGATGMRPAEPIPNPLYQFPVPSPLPPEQADLQSSLGGLDQQFMTDAIQAGLTEEETGRLARMNGQSDAVRQLGQRLVDDHRRANRQLVTIAERLGVALPGVPDAARQQHLTEMAALRGVEFDTSFARHVIIGEEALLGLFKREAKYGQTRELRDFAESVIPTLEQHLRTAVGLRDGGKAFSVL